MPSPSLHVFGDTIPFSTTFPTLWIPIPALTSFGPLPRHRLASPTESSDQAFKMRQSATSSMNLARERPGRVIPNTPGLIGRLRRSEVLYIQQKTSQRRSNGSQLCASHALV